VCLLERLCCGFSVPQGDEAASEAEVCLALLQYEAVVGPTLRGFSVEITCLLDVPFGFGDEGMSRHGGGRSRVMCTSVSSTKRSLAIPACPVVTRVRTISGRWRARQPILPSVTMSTNRATDPP
jgi:hypothetical protein